MTHRRFYLGSKLLTNFVDLFGSDAFHIYKVLRMSKGDFIELFNGEGMEYLAEIVYVSSNFVRVFIITKKSNQKDPLIFITLAQALIKDKKMDYIIRQLTELGIYEWIPFKADRSVANPSKKRIGLRLQKWKKISIESSKQCYRKTLPKISFANDFYEIIKISSKNNLSILFWEKSTFKINFIEKYIKNCKKISNKLLIIIGPEGGFSNREINFAQNNGFILASLSSRILRAETATINSLSVIKYLFTKTEKNLDI